MGKPEIEHLLKIKTRFLKKYHYLKRDSAGVITWYGSWNRKNEQAGIQTITIKDNKYARINYTLTSTRTSEKRDFNYTIPLTTTPCNFGGVRYWFRCQLIKNGELCNRRVANLYKYGDLFGCRHCHDLTYGSRNLSGFYKSFGVLLSDDELLQKEHEIRCRFYKGKPTKRYARFLRLTKRHEEMFNLGLSLLNKKTTDITKNK